MKLFNWFKKFKKHTDNVEEKQLKNNLNVPNLFEIKQFDDVWIKINDKIFEGWVVERVDDIIQIIYTDENLKLQDADFKIERPFTRDNIQQNGKTLFLIKPNCNENIS